MNEKLKVCMIGATAVGKTSLVARFTRSIFRERYETTIGVRIQARPVQRGEHAVNLVLWDLSGEDEFQSVQRSYLRGAGGYFLVVDGTRRETLDTALWLHERAQQATRGAPFVLVLNKSDLLDSWEIDAHALQALERRGWNVVRTSAKTGEGVEDAFNLLADAILEQRGKSWI